jgi:hypothetical protein
MTRNRGDPRPVGVSPGRDVGGQLWTNGTRTDSRARRTGRTGDDGGRTTGFGLGPGPASGPGRGRVVEQGPDAGPDSVARVLARSGRDPERWGT